MNFRIRGAITNVETIARGSQIRDHGRLRKFYGGTRWRKMKGKASIELGSGRVRVAELHWYEAHGIGKKEIKRKRFWIDPMRKRKEKSFVVCVKNPGYRASLERNKIYVRLSDPDAERDGDLRVIDESGEDYLYPADWFVRIRIPEPVEQSVLKEAS